MVLPEFEHLKTVRQLIDAYPDLFTEGKMRWWIHRADQNGFASCVVRIGKRLYIDTKQLQQWLASHRDSDLGDGDPARRAAS